MIQSFWANKWDIGQIGFHRDEVNDALLRFGPEVFGAQTCRILVPLCGMSMDLDWLVRQGHEVVGVEFVREAVERLAHRLGEPKTVDKLANGMERWNWSPAFSVLLGDFFELSAAQERSFDAVWDRASIVAIDPQKRPKYVHEVKKAVKSGGQILMRTFEYDQSEMDGPPFSVAERQIREALYADCEVYLLEDLRSDPEGKFQERGLTQQRVCTYRIVV